MTFSDLKDDVLRWMNPIIHPLEWTKDNFAEREILSLVHCLLFCLERLDTVPVYGAFFDFKSLSRH